MNRKMGVALGYLLAACGDNVIGEAACSGALARCAAQARVTYFASDRGGHVVSFDVMALDVITPRFSYRLDPCLDPIEGTGQCVNSASLLRAGPDSLWVHDIRYIETQSRVVTSLHRLSDRGELEIRHTPAVRGDAGPYPALSDGAGGISYAEAGERYDDGRQSWITRVVHMTGDGEQRVLELPTATSDPVDPGTLAIMPDGTLRMRSRLEPLSSLGVRAFEPDGSARWQERYLDYDGADASQYPLRHQIGAFGTVLPDMGYAFSATFADPASERGVLTGIVAIDAGGALRWAVGELVSSDENAWAFTADDAGRIAMTRPKSPRFEDFVLFVRAPDGGALATFVGRRVGYFSARSALITLDGDHAAYALLTHGARDRARLALCRLDFGADPGGVCKELALCEDEDTRTPYFGRDVADMPARSLLARPDGAVFVALEYACVADDRLDDARAPDELAALMLERVQRVMRFDF